MIEDHFVIHCFVRAVLLEHRLLYFFYTAMAKLLWDLTTTHYWSRSPKPYWLDLL